MKQKVASILWFFGGAVIVALVLFVLFTRGQWAGWFADVNEPDLPLAVNLNQLTNALEVVNESNSNEVASNANAPQTNEESIFEEFENGQIQIPNELNLDIPFTSQAPFGNWDAAHEEYCEEASLLMANRFLNNQPITGPADADAAMNAIAAWEVERFGYFESTTAEETAIIAREYLGLEAEVMPFNFVIIHEALINGRVVIIPAAGRELGNPFFTAPGPIYHMLVIKGWTEDYIITNDPGTKRGADYVYDPEVLQNAVGDYNHNDPSNGEKLMVVVGK